MTKPRNYDAKPRPVSAAHEQRHFFDTAEWHCSRVLTEAWLRFGCPDPAIVVYELPDGVRAGFCGRHRHEGDTHAATRGWKRVQPTLEAVA